MSTSKDPRASSSAVPNSPIASPYISSMSGSQRRLLNPCRWSEVAKVLTAELKYRLFLLVSGRCGIIPTHTPHIWSWYGFNSAGPVSSIGAKYSMINWISFSSSRDLTLACDRLLSDEANWALQAGFGHSRAEWSGVCNERDLLIHSASSAGLCLHLEGTRETKTNSCR